MIIPYIAGLSTNKNLFLTVLVAGKSEIMAVSGEGSLPGAPCLCGVGGMDQLCGVSFRGTNSINESSTLVTQSPLKGSAA